MEEIPVSRGSVLATGVGMGNFYLPATEVRSSVGMFPAPRVGSSHIPGVSNPFVSFANPAASGQGVQLARGSPNHSLPYTYDGRWLNGAQVPQYDLAHPTNFYHGRPDGPSSSTLGGRTNSTRSSYLEPKVTLPFFSGKSEWKVYWLQFERLARQFGWDSSTALDRLVTGLRDEALEYYAGLSLDVQGDLQLTAAAFSRRFDDCTLP